MRVAGFNSHLLLLPPPGVGPRLPQQEHWNKAGIAFVGSGLGLPAVSQCRTLACTAVTEPPSQDLGKDLWVKTYDPHSRAGPQTSDLSGLSQTLLLLCVSSGKHSLHPCTHHTDRARTLLSHSLNPHPSLRADLCDSSS